LNLLFDLAAEQTDENGRRTFLQTLFNHSPGDHDAAGASQFDKLLRTGLRASRMRISVPSSLGQLLANSKAVERLVAQKKVSLW